MVFDDRNEKNIEKPKNCPKIKIKFELLHVVHVVRGVCT